MGIKSQLSHYQQMQLKQVKYLNDMADAFQNRSNNHLLRKQIVDAQRVKNYSSEYERIRNHVANSVTPTLTQTHLKSRAEHLRTLGARAVDTIS